MDAKTLEALKGSIRKWEAIVAGTGVDEGSSNCALCQLFVAKDCRGCPVRAHTGHRRCSVTPYGHFVRLATSAGSSLRAVTPEAVAAAQAELDFLRSLLPPAEEA